MPALPIADKSTLDAVLAYVDELEARLTAARAGKLDNLDALISSRAPASTALTNAIWTAARAGKLDLIDTILAAPTVKKVKASDTVQASVLTERAVTYTTQASFIRTFRVPYSGKIRVKGEFKVGSTANASQCNCAAVRYNNQELGYFSGMTLTSSTEYVQFSWDIDVLEWSSVRVGMSNPNNGSYNYLRNIYICYDFDSTVEGCSVVDIF